MKRNNFLLLSIFAITSLASCGGGGEGKGVYTYRNYTMVSPSNWNELTYQDENDTQIMSQIGSSFFSFDYKFDSKGKIIDNDFTVNYDAATKLEDVTKTYAGNEKWGIPAGSQSARAYKITLRQDLKWDDGSKIDASDFVYTMKEQLAPEFKNYRADSFYTGANVIHNAKNYFNNGQKALATPTEVIANDKLSSVDAFLTKFGNEKGYINWDYSFGAVLDKDGNPIGEAKDEIVDSGLTIKQLRDLWVNMAAAFGTTEEVMVSYFLDEASMYYDFPKMDYDGNVGLFVGDNDFELVLILDNPLQLLEEDGSLSYKAAYNMSSLPLVQKSKYEANKQAPQLGSTLWTSTYNSDVSSTASWGPYKLTSFQTGKQYILEKNENWYGYNTDLYKGQYMTTRIVCETIPEWKSAWQAFQKGNLTSIGIDPSVAADYKNSSQAVFTPSDFVQSLQLQSSEKALRANSKAGVNKTILLQNDFRKAISLAIDRSEYAAKCTTSSKAGFGIFAIAHTKTKNIIEKGFEESEGYMTLTSNLPNTYEGVFGDIFDVVLTGLIDREIVDGKTTEATRKLYFRGTSYVDAGCRFAKDSVPEYMEFENSNNAKEFISIIKDGMKNSKSKPVSDEKFKELEKEEKEQLKEDVKQVAKEIEKQEKEEIELNKDELVKEIKTKATTSDNKKILVASIKELGKSKITELTGEELTDILNKLK